MPEYFRDVRLINLAPNGERAGIDIFFQRAENPPQTDVDVEKLRRDFEETMLVLQDVDVPKGEFETLVNELLAGAIVGLKGLQYNLDSGRSQLKKVRDKLLKRARGLRNAYLARLSFVGGITTIFALVLAGLLYFVVPQYLKDTDISAAYKAALAWIVPLCLLLPGDVLGVIFVSLVANQTLSFDKIRTFDPYGFPPWLRFFYIAIVSVVLFLALWFKFIMLGIGGYLLNDVKTDPSGGLVIGLLCGVSEALVVELLISRLKPVERGNAQA
jgi:hypothetical protein